MKELDPIRSAAFTLAAVAFAGSFVHVQHTVSAHGQKGWISWAIAAMPELMVGLTVLKLRRSQADSWTWVVGVTAVAFTVSANLAQAEPSVWGWVAAGWPAWAAVGSVMLIEGGPAKRAKPQVGRGSQAKPKPQPVTREPVVVDPEPSVGQPVALAVVHDGGDPRQYIADLLAKGVKPPTAHKRAVEKFGPGSVPSLSTVKRMAS